MNRYFDDPDFRSNLQRDPIVAAEGAGFVLDDDDREILTNADWGLPSEELKQRVSKRIRFK